jgi:hypothetical protein
MNDYDDYVPSKCVWKDVDKEESEKVLREFDIIIEKNKNRNRHYYEKERFNENECSIQVCQNYTLQGAPFYSKVCYPSDNYINKTKNRVLLVNKDQQNELYSKNPYSTEFGKPYSSQSPTSIIETGGFTRKRKRKRIKSGLNIQRQKQKKTIKSRHRRHRNTTRNH